jgi:hypothetical protein
MTNPKTARERTFLQHLIEAGHMRYWIIASWALALFTVTDLATAAIWFGAATSGGLLRTFVERKLVMPDAMMHGRIKLVAATLSCFAWSSPRCAPPRARP